MSRRVVRAARRAIEAALIAACVLYLFGVIAWVCGIWASQARGDTMASPAIRLSASAEEVLAGYYDSAARDINERVAVLTRQLAADPERRGARFELARQSQLARFTADRIQVADNQGRAALAEQLRELHRRGVIEAAKEIREIGAERIARVLGSEAGSIFGAGYSTEAVRAIAADSAARLRGALEDHGERAQTVFRSLTSGPLSGPAREQEINQAIARGLMQGDPRVAERLIREQMRLPGETPDLVSYRRLGNRMIEVGGWRGDVRTYARMVARTRTREAVETGYQAQIQRAGFGLVTITGRSSKNFCTRFLHLVCALTSEASEGGKYPLLSSLPGGKGPPFHPRCSKGTAAYHPLLVSTDRNNRAAYAAQKFEEARAAGELTTDLE